MPQFQAQYPETDPSAPRYGFNTGFMTGMLVLGGFVGCLLYPKLADIISRKWALTVAVGFFDLGAIIQTAAPNYGTLVAGRAIGGIGVGTLAMVSCKMGGLIGNIADGDRGLQYTSLRSRRQSFEGHSWYLRSSQLLLEQLYPIGLLMGLGQFAHVFQITP